MAVPQFTRDVTFREFLYQPAGSGETILEVRFTQIHGR
jgi:hypothetical protein